MASSSRRACALLPVAGALAIAGVLAFGAGGCQSQERSRPSATQEEDLKTVIIPIEGMSCSACAARIRRALTAIDGVEDVEVNLADRNARVRFAPSKLSLDRLVSAVNGLGYHASAPTEAP